MVTKTAAPARAATVAAHYNAAPQLREPSGASSWITRSANMVVVITAAKAGQVLARNADADEYMLLLPVGVSARVSAGTDALDASEDSLTIIPPGDSSVTLLSDGIVTRVFTPAVSDLADLAINRLAYAHGAPEVGPLPPITEPHTGWKLRNYRLAEFSDPTKFSKVFRSQRLMLSIFERKTDRRDPRLMSPHAHDDHEQISLALSGRFIHHLRTPWTVDSTAWRDDEHVEVDSPSSLVIPAGLIHTTQDIGPGTTWLVDVFAPPREDFLQIAGLVRNAAEY